MKSSFDRGNLLRNDPKIWLTVATILGAGLLTANAQLLSEDHFGYTPGDLTGNGFNGPTPFFAGNWDPGAAWGGTPGTVLQVQGANASYPGLQSSGNSLAVGSQTFSDGWAGANSVANRASRQFTTPWTSATDATTYYMSFLMSFGGDSINHVGYRAFEMWAGGVGDSPNRVLQLGYSTYGDFGNGVGLDNMWLRVNPNGGATPGNTLGVDNIIPVTGSVAFTNDANAMHLFVLRFDLSSTPGLDVIQLYLDPTDLVTEGANVPNAIFVGDFVASHLSAGSQFILPALIGAAGGPGDVPPQPANVGQFDELRIGGDWNSVLPVPEPSTLALLWLGGLGYTLFRRKKA
jgi:hypothetical protein